MTDPIPVPTVQIRAIITDLGNVVTPFDRRLCAVGLHETLVKDRSIDEIDRLLNTSEEAVEALRRFEIGASTEAAFLAALEATFGCELPVKTFWPIWCGMFTRNEPVIRLWLRVRRTNANVRLIALSDTDPRRLAWMVSLSGLRFDGHVTSYRVKQRKPHADTYAEAVRLARCPPEACLFVDDVPAYVEGARANGLKAHHYDPADHERDTKLRALVRAHGLIA